MQQEVGDDTGQLGMEGAKRGRQDGGVGGGGTQLKITSQLLGL